MQKFYRISFFLLFLSLLFVSFSWASEKVIEGPKDIIGKSLYVMNNGDIVVGGLTTSPSFGMKDVYIARFNKDYSTVWKHHYGGFFDDWVEDLYVDDKGIYLLGTTNSFGTGCSDVLFLWYSVSGRKKNMTPYGESYCEMAKSFVKTEDGFVILAKRRDSHASYIFTIDERGKVGMEIDIPHLEYPEGILYKKDVGYIVFGQTHDFGHDFKMGTYIALLDMKGKKIWDRVLGQDKEYFIKSATWDGYSIIFGGFSGLSLYNFWSPLLIKVDLAGNIEYEKPWKKKESEGITSLSFQNGTIYGGGFIKKNGVFHPALFKRRKDGNLEDIILNHEGKILDVKARKGKIYYVGYVNKGEKSALLIGKY